MPEEDGSLRPGDKLGPYEIVRLLGRGGMGDVYLGDDPGLGRRVAIKVFPREFDEDATFLERFRREAAAVARLNEPTLVRIDFVGQDRQHLFYAMEYIDGENLGQRLSREISLSAADAARVAVQCLAGLAAIHRLGLVHRDVKPANLLLERATGRVVLADFGLVRVDTAGTRLTVPGVVLGTMSYMAPEQLRGGDVDCRADLYSVGAVLYQMLSGAPPAAADVAAGPRASRPSLERALSDAVPSIPRELARIVQRLLEASPADRYASAADVIGEIQTFLDRGNPVDRECAAVSAVSTARYAGRRRLALWAGLAGVLGLVAALHVYSRVPRPDVAPTAAPVENPDAGATTEAPTESPKPRSHVRHLAGHLKQVMALAFSADSRQVVSASRDNTIRIWDVESGHELRQIEIDERAEMRRRDSSGGVVTTIENLAIGEYAFSPDLRFAIANRHRAPALYDLTSGTEIGTFYHAGANISLTFLPDSTAFITSDRNGKILWEVDGLRELRQFSGGPMNWPRCAPMISSDGARFLASGPDSGLHEWNTQTGLWSRRIFQKPNQDLRVVALSPGDRLLLANGGPYEIELRSADDGSLVRVLPLEEKMNPRVLAWGPDDRYALVAADDCTLRSWDLVLGRAVTIPTSHASEIVSVAVSPNGELAATAESNIQNGSTNEIGLWDVAPPPARAFSRGGRWMAAAQTGGIVEVWDRTRDRKSTELHVPDSGIHHLALSSDGRRLAVTDRAGRVTLWSVATGQLLGSLASHERPVWKVVFAPRDDLIATVGGDWYQQSVPGEVKVCDATTGAVLHDLRGHSQMVWDAAFSADGATLATVGGALPISAADRSTPGEICVWDVATAVRKRTYAPFGGAAISVAASPAKPLLAVSGCNDMAGGGAASVGKICFIDWESNQVQETTWPVDDQVWALEYDSSGGILAAAQANREMTLWSTETGKKQAAFAGHELIIPAMMFDVRRKMFVTAAATVREKVWPVPAASEPQSILDAGLAEYRHPGAIRDLAFSADGRILAVCGEFPFVQLWDTATRRGGCRLPLEPQMAARYATVSADGKLVAFAVHPRQSKQNMEIQVWETETAVRRDGYGRQRLSHEIRAMAFAPDRKRLLTLHPGGLEFWNVDDGAAAGHFARERLRNIDFLQNGRVLSLGDELFEIPDAADGPLGPRLLSTLVFRTQSAPRVGAGLLVISPDAQLLVESAERDALTMRSLRDQTSIATFPGTLAAFSSDGRWLATGGGRWEKGAALHRIVVRDPATGREINSCVGHTAPVSDLVFVPDSRALVSADQLGTVKFWDVESAVEN